MNWRRVATVVGFPLMIPKRTASPAGGVSTREPRQNRCYSLHGDGRIHPERALSSHKTHVNLVLAGPSASFADPDGRLEGTGKTGRHLKLRALEELPRAGSPLGAHGGRLRPSPVAARAAVGDRARSGRCPPSARTPTSVAARAGRGEFAFEPPRRHERLVRASPGRLDSFEPLTESRGSRARLTRRGIPQQRSAPQLIRARGGTAASALSSPLPWKRAGLHAAMPRGPPRGRAMPARTRRSRTRLLHAWSQGRWGSPRRILTSCRPPSSDSGMADGSTGRPSRRARATPRERRSGFVTSIA